MSSVLTLYLPITEYLCGQCHKNLSMGPIQLYNGHMFLCGRCSNGRLLFGLEHVRLENVCMQYKWPCCYQPAGCAYLGAFGTTKAHEDVCHFRNFPCPFRKFPCPMLKCFYMVSKENSEDHFFKDHAQQFIGTNTFTIPQKTRNKYQCLFKFGDRFFVLSVDVDGNPKMYKFWLTPVIWLDRRDVLYTITVTEEATPEVSISKRQVTSPIYLHRSQEEHMLIFCFESLTIIFDNKRDFVFKLEVEGSEDSYSSSANNLADSSSGTQIDNDKLLKELECPVCKNYMVAPIVLCERGHSLCAACMEKCHRKCPICQGRSDGTRNFTLEKLATCVRYPRVNKGLGCTFTSTIASIREYEISKTV